MENKIQELTDKIYREGVEKANTEAQSLLQKTEEEAQRIVNDAKLKAERRNKKEKLSEDDENYHKPEDFEENCYKERVKNLGAKRIIINDVELKIEIMNK